MGGIVSGITDAIGLTDSDAGAQAAQSAANTQAQAQMEALKYLREREAAPQAYREGALSILGGLYGLQGGSATPSGAPPRPVFEPVAGDSFVSDLVNKAKRQQYDAELAQWEAQYGGTGGQPVGMSQQDAIQALQDNPLYQATLGQIPQQEEAILRSQSATGAIRSSGTEQMLAENQRRNQMQAYQAALQPLSGLASLPSYAPQIAQGMAGIGQTQAQGIVGAEQSKQAAQQAGMSNLMGLGQLGLSAFAAFCDRRLKSNPVKIGETGGYNIYRWTWNEEANKLGMFGEGVGPMADEVEAREPERVTTLNGYKYVRAA